MRSILLILMFLSLPLFAQEYEAEFSIEPQSVVLNEFKFKFFKGDTLRYRISSQDSIVIEFGNPLRKDRFELVEVTCDSVSKDGKFFLTYTLKSYIADESLGAVEKVRRTTTPWLNRKTYIVIDSFGNRLSTFSKDTNLYAMSPGGAFQPHLFFNLKENYKFVNESWIVSSIDTLAENGMPYPILSQLSLLRADEPTDTLDYTCNKFNFIRTATGKVISVTDDVKILVESVINTGGNYFISNKDWIPVNMTYTMEQKLQITTPEKEAMPGYHYISSVYQLDSFIKSPLRIKYEQGLINPVNKK